MSMFIDRIRIVLKSVLSRGSILYRATRWVYRGLMQVRIWRSRGRPPREISENSIFVLEEEMSMCSIFPKEILDLTFELFRPRTVLDVGCGTGVSLDYFKKHGCDVRGIEGSELAITKARHRDLIQRFDLNEPVRLPQMFDLVWCFEVAEHIHPKFVVNFVETLTRHGDRLVLSAARPGQGGLGHLNEQPPEYWIGKLGARGFAFDEENSAKYWKLPDHFAANILVFRRATPTPSAAG